MTAILWLSIVALVAAALVTLARAVELLDSLTRVVGRLGALQERADLALEAEVVPLLESVDAVRDAGERLRLQTLGLAARLAPTAPAPHPLSAKALAAAGLANVFLSFASRGGRREQV